MYTDTHQCIACKLPNVQVLETRLSDAEQDQHLSSEELPADVDKMGKPKEQVEYKVGS